MKNHTLLIYITLFLTLCACHSENTEKEESPDITHQEEKKPEKQLLTGSPEIGVVISENTKISYEDGSTQKLKFGDIFQLAKDRKSSNEVYHVFHGSDRKLAKVAKENCKYLGTRGSSFPDTAWVWAWASNVGFNNNKYTEEFCLLILKHYPLYMLGIGNDNIGDIQLNGKNFAYWGFASTNYGGRSQEYWQRIINDPTVEKNAISHALLQQLWSANEFENFANFAHSNIKKHPKRLVSGWEWGGEIDYISASALFNRMNKDSVFGENKVKHIKQVIEESTNQRVCLLAYQHLALEELIRGNIEESHRILNEQLLENDHVFVHFIHQYLKKYGDYPQAIKWVKHAIDLNSKSLILQWKLVQLQVEGPGKLKDLHLEIDRDTLSYLLEAWEYNNNTPDEGLVSFLYDYHTDMMPYTTPMNQLLMFKEDSIPARLAYLESAPIIRYFRKDELAQKLYLYNEMVKIEDDKGNVFWISMKDADL